MQTPDKPPSFLTPIGYENTSCGYCHKRTGSFSYYASTKSMTAEFYESLLNRGWRRSGYTLYKPDLSNSCCPQYTVRLDSHAFYATRDQRQAVNRFNKYILGESYIKDAARLYPLSRDQAKRRNTEFDLIERIHEGEKSSLQTPPEPAHDLQVTLESTDYTEEKYALFENYQRIVHHEPPQRISRSGFKSFLCVSPVPQSKEMLNGRECQLGSYHHCYRLDGKLVALGVLDLLPQCVSAVYFMYHDSLHKHALGKIGALREIALAKELGYRFWYAGFYIHSCIKMRYKADYNPQYVLDPESFGWDLLNDEFKSRLEADKYVSMSHMNSNTVHEESSSPVAGKSNGVLDTGYASPSNGSTADESKSQLPTTPLPVFARSMPGVLNRDQLLTEIDLDLIRLCVKGTYAETRELSNWETSDIDNPMGIKGLIAELVAAVGADIAREMIVSFG